jgi:two-component system chemotaxis sensor kinase CheA
MDIRAKLLAAFQVEYKEHLEFIRQAMGKVESGEVAAAALPLDEVFRRAHSLKGAARACDLKPVETIAHRMETLLGRVRSGKAVLDEAALAIVRHGGDALEDWVVAFTKGHEPAEPTEAIAALDAYLVAQEAAPAPDVPVEAPAPRPSPPPPPPPPSPPAETKSKPKPKPAAPLVVAEETVRVRAASLDRLLRSAGRILTENLGQARVTQRLRTIEQEIAALEKGWRVLRQNDLAAPTIQSGDPKADAAADRRIAFMEQRIHALARETRSIRLMQQRTAFGFRQLGGELQEGIRQVRMIPAEDVFGDFRKMVRDIARDEGKDIDFRLQGLSVEADRLVFQALKDPVMHMLRNAIFHGIETPEERSAKGKDARGRVSLKFEIQGSRLVLLVEDDGRGIDVARIARQGVEEGLISEDEAATAGARDLARYIFRPGFSTADGVTDLAGRGMGMSVVYETVGRLSGSLEILIRESPGTAFRIEVPLSVSSHRLLLVTCRERIYGIPTQGIERVLRAWIGEVKTVEGRPTLLVEGQQVPLRGLADLLGLPGAEISIQDGQMPILVVRSGDIRAAIAVDSFLFIRDAVIKDLGVPHMPGSKAVGGILMEDGSVAVVLSPFELAEAFRHQGSVLGLVTSERKVAKKVPTIMVVDDSITTRTLEKSILEAHGYKVRIAVDGMDALMQLRTEAADLVVSDVEMPRIDGFSLLKELKKDRTLAHIPVILCTSLRRDEDLERGYSLGAEAYLVKQKFDHRELIETIEQIL